MTNPMGDLIYLGYYVDYLPLWGPIITNYPRTNETHTNYPLRTITQVPHLISVGVAVHMQFCCHTWGALYLPLKSFQLHLSCQLLVSFVCPSAFSFICLLFD